jgi:hypothetical protein
VCKKRIVTNFFANNGREPNNGVIFIPVFESELPLIAGKVSSS